MRSLQCQRCGQSFGCGVGSGSCWCAQVEVDREALAELTGGGGDCLGPDCLQLAAPAGQAPLAAPGGEAPLAAPAPAPVVPPAGA